MECALVGKARKYIGETNRTMWDRQGEHVKALVTDDDSYAVVKHWHE